jgi:hypothetical protein
VEARAPLADDFETALAALRRHRPQP